jgi:hypothetical protein
MAGNIDIVVSTTFVEIMKAMHGELTFLFKLPRTSAAAINTTIPLISLSPPGAKSWKNPVLSS